MTENIPCYKVPMKYKNCCLFERLFEVKKNGVFLFGNSSEVGDLMWSSAFEMARNSDKNSSSHVTFTQKILENH